MQHALATPRLVFDFPEPRAGGGATPVGTPVRRVYADPLEVFSATRVDEVRPALAEVERALARGLDAAGYLAYEAAPAFDPAFRVRANPRMPLLWFGIFEPGGGGDVEARRTGQVAGPASPTGDVARDARVAHLPEHWELEMSAEAWRDAVQAVREDLAAGRSYQVNLTLRMRSRLEAGAAPARGPGAGDRGREPTGAGAPGHEPQDAGERDRREADAVGDLGPLYERLRRAQGRGYHALLDLGEHAVLSVSPELFFQVEGRDVLTRPMKGTRPRGRWEEEDARRARELLTSEKELAENRMIVDLLRNDLGRVCEIGSVRVPRLMDVERYRTVLQMTSTVAGRLRAGVGLTGVLEALFPCGSVTGAPKVSTMQIIAEREVSPREVYCGAVGFAEGASGRAVFNVPIRTLWVDRRDGKATYGSGGGITWDSDPGEEYAELLAKAAVLARPWPDFDLLETMRLEGGEVRRLERHLARLASSCRYFGRAFPEEEVREAIGKAVRGGEAHSGPGGSGGLHRLRLTLSEAGEVTLENTPLVGVGVAEPDAPPAPEPSGGGGALPPVVLAGHPVDAGDIFLFHKTTHRRVYEARSAAHPDAFDVLLHNGEGRVTEFTRGNVVADLGGRLVTPPREDGLLAGCFRDVLLESGVVEEASLTREDVMAARRLWLVNSVREWVEVRLSPGPAGGRSLPGPGGAASSTGRPRSP